MRTQHLVAEPLDCRNISLIDSINAKPRDRADGSVAGLFAQTGRPGGSPL